MSVERSPMRQGRFLAGSIALHVALFAAYGVPAVLAHLAEERRIAAAAAAAAEAEERERAAEASAIAAAERARLDAAKGEVVSALKKDYERLLRGAEEGLETEALWDDVVGDLDGALDDYAGELLDAGADDAALREGLAGLRGELVSALRDRLKQMEAAALAAAALAQARDALVPAVAERYRDEIAKRAGDPLAAAAKKIADDERGLVERERAAIGTTLDGAAADARRAADALAAAAADPTAATGKTAEAEAALANAGKQLDDARTRAEAFSDAAAGAVADAQPARERAETTTAEAAAAAKAGDAATAERATTGQAAAAALGEAIAAAQTAAAAAEFDPAALARAVMREAAATGVRPAVDEAFAGALDREIAPRLAAKVGEKLAAELAEAGAADAALVASVQAEVEKLLRGAVPERVGAGAAATAALTTGLALDQPIAGVDANGAREAAVAKSFAESAAKAGEAVGGLGADDGIATALVGALPKLTGAGTGAAGAGEGEGGSGAGSNRALARLNALAGRLGGDGAGDLEGFGAGGGIGGLRKAAAAAGGFGRGRGYRDDRAARAKLTEDVVARDADAARGEDWERVGAEGAVSEAVHGDAARPAAVVAPRVDGDAPAGIAAAATPYAPRFATISFAAARFAQTPPTIDGDLAEWKDVPTIELRPNRGAAEGLIAVEAQTARVQWDASGLWLACEVVDADRAITATVPYDFWNGDGVEIWFDTLNAKPEGRNLDTQQFWVWAADQKDAPGVVGGEAVKAKADGNWKATSYAATDILRASRPTERGWTLELRLPARLIQGFEPRPGRIIGFNLSMCTGTSLLYYWAGTSDVRTSEHPSTWGDLLLAGSDGRIMAPTKRARDLAPGESAEARRSVAPGEPLRLRVEDADMDLASDRVDQVSVTARARGGDWEVAVLGETGPATGVFEGALATALNLGEDLPGTLSLDEGDVVEAVYCDQARADGSRSVDVTLTLPTGLGASNLLGR